MDTITVRCSSCKHTLKVGADKAGRKTRCTKCGTAIPIPKAEKEEEKPAAPAVPPPPAGGEDDDGPMTYGVVQVEVPEEKKEDKKQKKEKPKVQIKKKPKTLKDPELWEKVRVGLTIMFVATCIWGLAQLLQVVVVLLGVLAGPQYPEVADQHLFPKDAPPWQPGESIPMNRTSFLVGLVAGTDNVGLATGLMIGAAVLLMVMQGIYIAGFATCLPVPDRFGTKLQLMILLGLAAFNLLLTLVLRVLPLLGVIGPVVPLLFPEVAMGVGNINRGTPLHAFWSVLPFWETLLAILCHFLFFIQPILVGVFLRAVALSLRDDDLEPASMGLMHIGFGQAFTLLAYYLLSVGGNSEVLSYVLRLAYLLWLGFLTGFIVRVARTLMGAQKLLAKYLTATEEKEAEGEGEETEEAKPKPKAKVKEKEKVKKKKKRADDDDDDDDDDD